MSRASWLAVSRAQLGSASVSPMEEGSNLVPSLSFSLSFHRSLSSLSSFSLFLSLSISTLYTHPGSPSPFLLCLFLFRESLYFKNLFFLFTFISRSLFLHHLLPLPLGSALLSSRNGWVENAPRRTITKQRRRMGRLGGPIKRRIVCSRRNTSTVKDTNATSRGLWINL
jgi:hypothetical protein